MSSLKIFKGYVLAAVGVFFLVEVAGLLVAYWFGIKVDQPPMILLPILIVCIVLTSSSHQPDRVTLESDFDLTQQASIIAQRLNIQPISVSQDKKLNKPKVVNYFLLEDTVYISPHAHKTLNESEWQFFLTKATLERQTWETESRLHGRNLVLVALLVSLSLAFLQLRLPWLPVSVFILLAAALVVALYRPLKILETERYDRAAAFTGDLPSAQSAHAKIAKYWAI